MPSFQKFASAHSSVHNHFNLQRNIERSARFKSLRDAALREWRDLLVALHPLVREQWRRVRNGLRAPTPPPFKLRHAPAVDTRAISLNKRKEIVDVQGFQHALSGAYL